jgi:hypothetical protein
MARYGVGFEGKWQGEFDDVGDALDWGQDVGESGRLVYVGERRWLRGWRLVAVFPIDRTVEGEYLWERQGVYAGATGS